MGLIKALSSVIGAGKNAIGGNLSDQWKEFFYCDAIPADVLVVKGQKKVSGRSSNNGDDNIISNGSRIAVADGQCMIIVDNGKVVEICAEPGEYTFDTSAAPSIFAGNLGANIKASFSDMVERFTYGGEAARIQRVYYFNTKEIIDNKFGTPNPVPFRVVDSKIALDLDVSIRCSGVYSYKIVDPIAFYVNVCGNINGNYTRSMIDNQLKTEFVSALQPAFGKLSDMEIRPNQIVSHNTDIEVALNEILSEKWGKLRGIVVVNVAIGTVTLPDEDADMIKEAQRNAQQAIFNSNAQYAAGNLAAAQAEALKAAANNAGGAMLGFANVGMAQQAGGINAQQLFAMGQQQAQAQPAAAGWTCSCGTVNTGKFCSNCGTQNPAAASWTCSCGTVNTGKFCSNCGTPRA